MIYQNMPCVKLTDDLNGNDLKKADLITIKEREFRKNRYIEEMAHYAMLWLKYFRKESTSYYELVNSVLCDDFTYNKSEITQMVNESIAVLKKKYNIDVISYKPLILSSNIPFNQISENMN